MILSLVLTIAVYAVFTFLMTFVEWPEKDFMENYTGPMVVEVLVDLPQERTVDPPEVEEEQVEEPPEVQQEPDVIAEEEHAVTPSDDQNDSASPADVAVSNTSSPRESVSDTAGTAAETAEEVPEMQSAAQGRAEGSVSAERNRGEAAEFSFDTIEQRFNNTGTSDEWSQGTEVVYGETTGTAETPRDTRTTSGTEEGDSGESIFSGSLLENLDTQLNQRDTATASSEDTSSSSSQSSTADQNSQDDESFDEQTETLTFEELSRQRKLISMSDPVLPDDYTPDGRTEFDVVVSFTLLSNGLLTDLKFVKQSGYSVVDSAILSAMRGWRFESTAGGRSVEVNMVYVITTRDDGN